MSSYGLTRIRVIIVLLSPAVILMTCSVIPSTDWRLQLAWFFVHVCFLVALMVLILHEFFNGSKLYAYIMSRMASGKPVVLISLYGKRHHACMTTNPNGRLLVRGPLNQKYFLHPAGIVFQHLEIARYWYPCPDWAFWLPLDLEDQMAHVMSNDLPDFHLLMDLSEQDRYRALFEHRRTIVNQLKQGDE